MSAPLTLSAEFRKIVEARMAQVLRGVEETFNAIIEKQKITPTDLTAELESLQDSFNMIFQKWSLEILYTIMLKGIIGFGEVKKILGVNSRTLSDKLKMLQIHGYINRKVTAGPPLRVEYSLTPKGKNTVLLALPLLYYSAEAKA
jgi:DNA-binding HxlR family transcriptional regulator